MFSLFLPEEVVPDDERRIRNKFNFAFRLLLASFLSYQTFDFLFSAIWMHGYVWSLNQKIEIEMSTKTAAAIFEHQLLKCSFEERVCFSVLLVFMVWALLFIGGFRGQNRNVWYLLRLSMLTGWVVTFVRCLQMKQRLYPAIHEGFYVYFVTFIIGAVLALQPEERLSKGADITKVVKDTSGEGEQNKEEAEPSTDTNEELCADSWEMIGSRRSSES